VIVVPLVLLVALTDHQPVPHLPSSGIRKHINQQHTIVAGQRSKWNSVSVSLSIHMTEDDEQPHSFRHQTHPCLSREGPIPKTHKAG
jgi:hypothetical protein